MLCGEEATDEVAVQDLAQNAQLQVEHAGDRRHPARIADQRVDPAPARVDRGGRGADLGFVGDIGKLDLVLTGLAAR